MSRKSMCFFKHYNTNKCVSGNIEYYSDTDENECTFYGLLHTLLYNATTCRSCPYNAYTCHFMPCLYKWTLITFYYSDQTLVKVDLSHDPTYPRSKNPCPKCGHEESVFFQSRSKAKDTTMKVEWRNNYYYCVFMMFYCHVILLNYHWIIMHVYLPFCFYFVALFCMLSFTMRV